MAKIKQDIERRRVWERQRERMEERKRKRNSQEQRGGQSNKDRETYEELFIKYIIIID